MALRTAAALDLQPLFPSGRIRSEPVNAVRSAILETVEQWRQEPDSVILFID